MIEVIRKRFTVGEYDQMIEAGIFHEDERLELVAGEIIEVYRQPEFEGYGVVNTFSLNDALAPQAFPECLLKVSEIIRD